MFISSRMVLFSVWFFFFSSPILMAGILGQEVQQFAHFVVGAGTSTTFSIHNAGEEAIVVSGQLRDRSGALFASFEVELEPGATQSVSQESEGELLTGWATLTGTGPFTATEFIHIVVGNRRLPTIGVLPSQPTTRSRVFAFLSSPDAGPAGLSPPSVNTGLAMANLSPTVAANVTVKRLMKSGDVEGMTQFALGPEEQTANFLNSDRFFPQLVEFEGTLEIESDRPVILTALRSEDNEISSVAVDIPKAGQGAPGSITTELLADSAVTNAKIADGAITGEKIDDGEVVREVNGLSDDVSIIAGANISVFTNQVTRTLTISAPGGPGGDIAGVVAGDGLSGGGTAGTVTVSIADEGVTRSKMAEDSVGFDQLANDVSFGRVELPGAAPVGDIEPDNSPNLILGHPANSVSGGVIGATIGGGGLDTGFVPFGSSGSSPAVANPFPSQVTGDFGTISGGYDNVADGEAVVGGGSSNEATGDNSSIGGGRENTASGNSATIGGGFGNIASGASSTIGGGTGNRADGNRSVVVGGSANRAAGTNSFAGGRTAIATHDFSFVWSSGATAFETQSANTFIIDAPGGIGINNNDPQFPIHHISGANLSAGGTWTNASDRNLKENLSPVNGESILEALQQMPIFSWNYKVESSEVQHIGPTAQDFKATFGVGGDDRSISTVDADGVALSALQALAARVAAQAEEIEGLKALLKGLTGQ